MKNTYLKPDMQIVQMQHQHQLLVASSLSSVSTNLDEDALEIDDTSQSSWGR